MTALSANKIKNFIIAAIILFFASLAVINIKIAPPPEFSGSLVVDGMIAECDFRGLSKYSSRFFVGISLDNPEAPYLRVNPLHREKDRYRSLCQEKPNVLVTYHATKRLVGPVRFWVDKIEPL